LPRTKLQNEQLKQERKQMIAECGLKVFCEKSFNGTQMTDIAKKLGVSHGLIYHYFKNKQELFEYVIDKSEQALSSEIDKIVKSNTNNTEKLIALTDYLLNSSIKDKIFPFQFFTILTKRFQDINLYGIFEKKRKHKHGFFEPLKEIFENGEKNGEFTLTHGFKQSVLLYFSIIHGAILGYILSPESCRESFEFLKTKTIVEIFIKK
jgi:AcrR family transcriptional regulator